jgi:tetratricopeptide (TPR) repeat protein
MRRVVISISIIMLGLITNSVLSGQSSDTTPRIVYLYDASWISLDYADNFLENVQAQLQAYDIEVRFELGEETDEWINIVFFDDSLRLGGKSSPKHHLRESPILYPNETNPYCCQTNPFAVMQPFTVNEESLPAIERLVVGIGLYQAGLYDESYQYLDTLADELVPYYELLPTGLETFINFYQANNSLLLGNFENGIRLLETTIFELERSRTEETINLAWLYIHTGRTEDGLTLLSEKFDITPEDVQTRMHTDGWIYLYDILRRRAQLYALAFDYDSAIADMDAAIELAEVNEVSDEQLAELYTLRGEIIFLIYEWDRVLENFNTALELAPDFAPAYFQRGVLYYTMTEREHALADFQHYLEIAPDGEDAAEAQRYIDSIQLELESLGG